MEGRRISVHRYSLNETQNYFKVYDDIKEWQKVHSKEEVREVAMVVVKSQNLSKV